jgi:archaeal/vacuolar-type H+-ATPase subunit H
MESSIYSLLDTLEDIVENAKAIPLTQKVSVSKDELLELIGEIRLNMPGEVKQAQRIVHGSEKIIDEANAKANSIIRDAESNAEKMTLEHEITKRAKEEAEAIMADARNRAEDMRIGSIEYADQMLANTEAQIKNVLDNFTKRANNVQDFLATESDAIYGERQELRALADNKPVSLN